MSWINLYSDVTYTEAQLIHRYDREIERVFPGPVERIINQKKMLSSKGKYLFTKKDLAQEKNYEDHCGNIKVELEQASMDNELLIEVIEYEQAERRLQKYILSEGRKAIPEVPAKIDPETGEILIEGVPAIRSISPLPLIIEKPIFDDAGELTGREKVPNPLIIRDAEEREEANLIINKAGVFITTLVNSRKINVKGI